MSEIEIEFEWRIASRFQTGSGISRPGGADHCIRVDAAGNPVLTPEAAKGAIRQSAEAVARWLVPLPASVDAAATCHVIGFPTLYRLLSGGSGTHFWRIGTPVLVQPDGNVTTYASTAIDPNTRVAKTDHLRREEYWEGSPIFRIRYEGYGLDLAPETADWYETFFLLLAIVSAEEIGGSRGTGSGEVLLESLDVGPATVEWKANLQSPEQIQKLSNSLKEIHD